MNTHARHLLQLSVLVCASCLRAFAQTPSQSSSPEAFPAAALIEQVLSVTSIGGVAISPDGSQVAYTLTPHDAKGAGLGSEIHIVSAGGGADRPLADGASPAWSPDGSAIAYFSSAGGSRQIWTIPAAGGEPRKVTQHSGYIDRFQWAPDSKRIAMLFRQAHEAGLGFLTKAPHPLMPIVVDVNNLPMNQLAIVDLATTTTEAITPRSYSVGGFEQWFPDTFSWSPDGERIVFTQRPHAKAGGHLYGDIVSVTHRGQASRRLVEQEGMDAHPVWSPDGRQIATSQPSATTG